MVAACHGERRQSRARARAPARRGLAERARQGLPRRDADGLRPLGRAAARRVDREAGQGPRAGARRAADGAGPPARRGPRSRTPYDLGAELFRWEFATAVAGHVLGINPFDQPDVQAAKDKTSEVLARGRAGRSIRAGSVDELLGAGSAGRLRRDPGVHRPRARGGARAARRQRARETGCVVTVGLGPRYLHSTGQLHKGGPNTGLFVQVVDETGDELPIPGARLRLRPADPRAGGRRPRRARGAGPACRPRETGGAMKLGMVGLGRMGSGMTKRLEQHGHEVADVRPERGRRRRRRSRALAKQLEPPRHVWLMVPAGKITEDTFRKLLGDPRARRHDRRRRQLELARLAAAARARRASTSSTSSTSASRAGSGASRSASA